MLDELRSYILEDKFKITILIDKVDIVNYSEIDHFDDREIIVKYSKGVVIIKGENLSIAKLLNEEILIIGKIKKVEFDV